METVMHVINTISVIFLILCLCGIYLDWKRKRDFRRAQTHFENKMHDIFRQSGYSFFGGGKSPLTLTKPSEREILEEALKLSEETEDYQLASIIRDKIKEYDRKQKTKS